MILYLLLVVKLFFNEGIEIPSLSCNGNVDSCFQYPKILKYFKVTCLITCLVLY